MSCMALSAKLLSQNYRASPAIWDPTVLHLPPNTDERAHFNPSQTSWYSIYTTSEGRKTKLSSVLIIFGSHVRR